MLNVGRVRVLSEVVRRGSFSAAAGGLSYTPSGGSTSIARLRAETGATLIIRDRGGVRPTAAGASLVEHAEGIFARIDAAEADLAAVLGVRSGRLRAASFPSAGATLMPQAIASFRQRHPDVALTLARGDRAATARRRVRPRAALRLPRFRHARAPRRASAHEAPARGFDARRAARRARARREAGAGPRGPAPGRR